jgi:TctA family transporter
LLGLLLGAVGTDVASGSERLTFGLDLLADGISLPLLALGLLVAADGLVGFLAPSLLVATYVRQIAGLASFPIATSAALGLRALAAIALAASIYWAYALNNSQLDVYALLVFAAFGIACKILDWNRLVLLLAFVLQPQLEEHIRRALLISRGSLDIFVRSPIGTVMLALAGVTLLAAALLAAVHAARLRRRAG